ncbi:hypothetical protein FR483_n050L [Paramecium bursaria Chlorella virus FR483]|uniref:Uncharacterized protein n050L n=1 Tax=Paramecium bursaria Chlorella virus FR483 TaxID=399781 RepID=A7J6A4_PBCVF|nr:hypothetical protein FR483_n050L [Paramecium bursaria Chlorella virus FR483]ABT15335.1 hypothetical protein FR483_n050L [Paramecium bursaria Chlorella virus FR483]
MGRETNKSVENTFTFPDHTPLENDQGVFKRWVTFPGRFTKGASGFTGMLYVVMFTAVDVYCCNCIVHPVVLEYNMVFATFAVNPVVGGTNDGKGEPPAPNMIPCNNEPSPAKLPATTFPMTFA